MTILKGDRGGLAFLVNNAQKTFYYFGIEQDGSYILDHFKGEEATILLKGDASTLIHTGFNTREMASENCSHLDNSAASCFRPVRVSE